MDHTPNISHRILATRSVIRLSGDGVLAFLHNLLTTDVADLKPGHVAYGALLSPQGKVQHEVFVHGGDGVVHIDCVAGQRDELLRRLIMYRLRAKFEIAAEDGLAVAVGGDAPLDPRLAEMGGRALVAAGSLPHDTGYLEAQMTLGLGDGARDIGQNLHFPHEANLDFLHGVNFHKGCYVGQEVVSRMQHRGTARARMLPVRFDQETDAADIRSGEVAIGTVLSRIGKYGLALVRLDRLADAQHPLLTGDVKTTVQKPAWMKLEFTIPEIAR